MRRVFNISRILERPCGRVMTANFKLYTPGIGDFGQYAIKRADIENDSIIWNSFSGGRSAGFSSRSLLLEAGNLPQDIGFHCTDQDFG